MTDMLTQIWEKAWPAEANRLNICQGCHDPLPCACTPECDNCGERRPTVCTHEYLNEFNQTETIQLCNECRDTEYHP